MSPIRSLAPPAPPAPAAVPAAVSPRYTTLKIDPALAEQWLSANTHNRRLNSRLVAKYAATITNGDWDEAAPVAPISFDINGVLINGQHRLWAIVESGATLELTVVFDAAPKSFEVIDNGSKRSTAQVAQLSGIKNSSAVVSVAGYVLRYDREKFAVWRSDNPLVTPEEALNYCRENDDLLQRAYAESTSLRPYLSFGNLNVALAVAVILRDTAHPEKWEDFSRGIKTGAGLDVGDPRLALRNFKAGYDPRARRNTKNQYLRKQLEVGQFIKAWNAYVKGTEIKQVRFTEKELTVSGLAVPL